MMKALRIWTLFTFAAAALFSLGVAEAAFPNDFEVYFPQVAHGTQVLHIETILTVINPHAEPVDISLEAFGVELPQESIQLAPLERREVRFDGEPLRVGWVRLVSPRVVSASARIVTKSPDSQEILGNISVLGQAPTSKVIIPVQLNTPSADNTGIALAYIQEGRLRFTLYDSTGSEVASREEPRGFTLTGVQAEHASFFVDELFTSLPPDLNEAFLVIEHVLPDRIAVAFAATALYTLDDRLLTAEVTGIDDAREYVVFPNPSEESVEAVAQALAATHGFEIERIVGQAISGVMTFEQARAVARDPRVREVHPNNALLTP